MIRQERSGIWPDAFGREDDVEVINFMNGEENPAVKSFWW